MVRALVCLASDDRDAGALAACGRARTAAAELPDALGRATGLEARVLYLRGAMVEALAATEAGGRESAHAGSRRGLAAQRAGIFGATKDRERSSATLKRLLDELPESDHRANDWLNYGFELAHAGRYADAKVAFLDLARALPDFPRCALRQESRRAARCAARGGAASRAHVSDDGAEAQCTLRARGPSSARSARARDRRVAGRDRRRSEARCRHADARDRAVPARPAHRGASHPRRRCRDQGRPSTSGCP